MAKRSKQQTMYQPSQQLKRRPPAGKSPAGKAAGKAVTNKSTSRPVSKQVGPGAARAYNRPISSAALAPAGANPLLVRIAAIVIALAAAIGGTVWALSLKGAYGASQVAGLILLGLLAVSAIAVAVRTEDIVSRAVMYMKRLK